MSPETEKSEPAAAPSPQSAPASLRPIASYLGMLAGVAGFGYGLMVLFGGAPLTYAVAMLLSGFVELVVCFFALRGNRAAWAFALSLNGTAALVFLFGATRVRAALSVPWPVALVPALLLVLITTFYAVSAVDYEGRGRD